MEKRKRSSVWKNFCDIGGSKAKCNLCQRIMSIKGGTISNLARHLQSRHFIRSLPVYISFKTEKDPLITQTECKVERIESNDEDGDVRRMNIKVPVQDQNVQEETFNDTPSGEENLEITENKVEYVVETPKLSDGQENEVIYLQYSGDSCKKNSKKHLSPNNNTKLVEMIERNAREKNDLMREVRKRKRIEEDEDDIDAFFRSMALTVKKFPPEMLIEAKLKICNIVAQFEYKHLKRLGTNRSKSEEKPVIENFIELLNVEEA